MFLFVVQEFAGVSGQFSQGVMGLLLFFMSLATSLVLTGAVLLLLTKCLTVNWERKNRHPVSYLMPVVLTVILLYLSLSMTVPRLLDAMSVAAQTFTIEEVDLTDEVIGRMTLQTSGRTLHYNPRQFSFESGQSIRLKYTPRSRFIFEVTEIGQE